jgi:hypothetical protein
LHVFPATDTYSYAEAIERSLVDDGVDWQVYSPDTVIHQQSQFLYIC